MCVRAWLFVCVQARVYLCVCVCAHVQECIYRVCACLSVRVRTRVCVLLCISTQCVPVCRSLVVTDIQCVYKFMSL